MQNQRYKTDDEWYEDERLGNIHFHYVSIGHIAMIYLTYYASFGVFLQPPAEPYEFTATLTILNVRA